MGVTAYARTAAATALAIAALTAPAAHAVPPPAAACTAAHAGKADINGDGYDDTVIGDPGAGTGDRVGAGAVTVLYGGKGGIGTGGSATLTQDSPGVATAAGPGAASGDGFGWSVATAHIDDDPCLDVVIGAPWRDVDGKPDVGAVYVVYGSPRGLGRGKAGTVLTPDTWDGSQARALFGFSLAAADATGDDRSAIAAGAPYTDRGPKPNAGEAYAMWFTKNGTPQNRKVFAEDDPQTREGALAGGLFGWSVAIGPLYGDPRRDDLMVGAPREPSAGPAHPGALALLADVSGPSPSAVRTLGPADLGLSATGDVRIGYALAYLPGPVDYLAVGAPGAEVSGHPDAGAVPLLRSNGADFALQETVTEGTHGSTTVVEDGDQFGRSVALGRDPKGRVRLGVGMPYETSRVRHDGAAEVVPLAGGRARDLNQAVTGVPGNPGESAHFGWSVRFAGAAGSGPFLAGIPDDRDHVSGSVIEAPDTGAPRLVVPPPSPSQPLDFGAAL
ncbi:MAG TPA: FG-GAP repeat protein [Streptosporangiaceae bacterium]|jgi:hypothetical protein